MFLSLGSYFLIDKGVGSDDPQIDSTTLDFLSLQPLPSTGTMESPLVFCICVMGAWPYSALAGVEGRAEEPSEAPEQD